LEIAETADRLATHIENSIGALQADFSRATGIESLVRPPRDLVSLFQAFGVSTRTGEGEIPLVLRGDGIQGRFLPSVLRYIADSSNDHFIWGFEEPENSLEYAHAVQLAEDFRETYSSSAQCFVTSHSPAFTTARDNSMAVFRVSRNAGATEVLPVDDPSALEMDLGYLAIYEDLHRRLEAAVAEQAAMDGRLAEVEAEARLRARPVVVVEGESDERLLNLAWTRLRPGLDCPFIVCRADPEPGVGGGVSAVKRALESMFPKHVGGAVGVFDRDREGLKGFAGLPASFVQHGEEATKVSLGRNAGAVLLPVPSGRERHARLKILEIEHLFPDELLRRRTPEDHGLDLEQVPAFVVVEGERLQDEEVQLDILEGVEKVVSGKVLFAAQVAPTFGAEEFAGFEPLLAAVEACMQAAVGK
jgi:hypothetical protein